MIEIVRRFGRALALTVLLVPVCMATGSAQSRIEAGVEGGWLLTRPLGTLTSVNGITPCSEVLAGEVSGSPAGGIFSTFVFDSGPAGLRGIRLSAGYESPALWFRSGRNRFEAFDSRDASYVVLETEYAAQFRLEILRAAIELEAEPIEGVMARFGPSLRIPVSGQAEETESILSPAGATFLDRRQIREIPGTTGELKAPAIVIGATASVARRLPLSRVLFVEPALAADIGFTSIEPSWSIGSIRFGVAIGYSAPRQTNAVEPRIDSVAPLPVELPVAPAFTGEIDLMLDVERVPIELRRQIVARYVPLLPVLFFDSGSAEIAERYTIRSERAGREFDENRVSSSADLAHRDILDIVGSRLARTPAAQVTITGTTSIDEQNRSELARARSERAAGYLEQRWGIDRRRMSVRSRIDPAVASNPERTEGREENRRVELEFSDDAIYRPIQIRSVEPAADPESLSWRVRRRLSRPAARWELAIERSGSTLRTIEIIAPDLNTISWKPTQRERELMLDGGDITYRMRAVDSSGAMVESAAETLPLRLDTTITIAGASDRPDNTAEFLLVTFDFDRAELTSRGREELKSILERIGPTSTISITGYTDRTGESLRNRQLAEERAARIARQMPVDRSVTVRGAAPDEAPYEGSTPEGRFLSRTVRVVVTEPR